MIAELQLSTENADAIATGMVHRPPSSRIFRGTDPGVVAVDGDVVTITAATENGIEATLRYVGDRGAAIRIPDSMAPIGTVETWDTIDRRHAATGDCSGIGAST